MPFAAGGGGPTCGTSTTCWNPSDKSGLIGLTTTNFANDTATQNSATQTTWASVRGTNSPAKTAGRWHIEFSLAALDAIGGIMVGFADSTLPLAGMCGATAGGISVMSQRAPDQMQFYVNGAGVGSPHPVTVAVGDRWALEVDIPNKLVWVQSFTHNQGNWTDAASGFTGVPGTSGGTVATFTTTAATNPGIMPCFSGYNNAGVADTVIMYTKLGQFSVTPTTSGTGNFLAWDAG
jgi:hypothetical protein